MAERELLSGELSRLFERVDQLVELNRRLLDENQRLRLAHDQAAADRAALLSKHEQARSRIEAMIHRLKALEQGS